MKKISINPELFSTSKSTRSTKSSKPKTNIHKHIVKEMNKHKNKSITDNTSDDFSYLAKLSNLRRLRKSKKNNPSQPTSIIKDPPQYGILKHTGKPTWREHHNKTLKQQSLSINHNSSPAKDKDTPLPSKDKDTPSLSKDKDTPSSSKDNHQDIPTTPTITPSVLKPISASTSQIKPNKSKTYKLGKSKHKVSILIKNKKTRKRILDDKKILENTPIKEIKEYLKKRNLYKAGSNAPSYILKQTYINSNLGGDIKNLSDKTLLHNYIST